MLTHLSIQNFTLVDSLELELSGGMTAITGETGAGKSILLDALGLALGGRADTDRIRSGQPRADICATFDITHIPLAQQWMEDHDLANSDECLLRRVVTREGRSRGYINGQSAPLGQLKQLGEMLIDIHSQHAHQSLLKKDTHRILLDNYANANDLAAQCRQAFQRWQEKQTHYLHLRDNAEETTARLQLLRYQVQELDALALEDGELEQIEAEQKQLTNAEDTLQNCRSVVQICDDEEAGLLSSLHKALGLLGNIENKPAALQSAEELLTSAQIQVQEAQAEISHYSDNFEVDPQHLQDIEERLSSCYGISRKHRINPDQLTELHRTLNGELESLGGSEGQLDQLEAETDQAKSGYLEIAEQLSAHRKQATITLQKAINEQLQALDMASAKMEIHLASDAQYAAASGIDDIEFLISTNPGQSVRPFAKVASGGELSRISLAVQVVTAQSSTIPTLVFDEVDVGIGGATADIVGQLLRKLGQQGQVICVTHLPQVASKCHQHLQVHKQTNEASAQSTLSELEGEEKVMEIARMMGGQQLSDQTIAHAKEMLELAS